jgi:hypothetical protein
MNPGVPSNLSCIILQQLPILLPHRNKELVNGHGRVDRNLPPKQCVDLVFLVDRRERRPRRTSARAGEPEYLNGSGCVFGDETGETFDTHLVVVDVVVVVGVRVATRPDETSA